MKTLKITLTPDQQIQLANAATLEIDLPDYDQLANELQSAKATLEAIAAILNPDEYPDFTLPELLQQRLTEAVGDGFQLGVVHHLNGEKKND